MPESPSTLFHHVAIMTDEFDRTTSFYVDVLGFRPLLEWELSPDPERSRAAYLDGGNGAIIELFELRASSPRMAADWSRSGEMVHICVSTDDIDGLLKRVQEFGLGLTTTVGSVDLHDHSGVGTVSARLCFFDGPAGENIELISGVPTYEELVAQGIRT